MNGPSTTIIDYGIGNVTSLKNSLLRLGYHRVTISGDPQTLLRSDFVILPGVGAYQACMTAISSADLAQPLNEYVLSLKRPILGICVGMQMMVEDSREFGLHSGFGWLEGSVHQLKQTSNHPLPHVGWNDVLWMPSSAIDFSSLNGMNFYFDHSYAIANPSQNQIASTDYGGPVCAAVGRENVLGVQFHPEKSQTAGLRFLRHAIEGLASC